MASIGRTVISLTQIAIGFLLLPFLLSQLGAHWYGVWTVLGSLVAYFYILDVGLGFAVQIYSARHIATKQYDKANEIVNTALVLYCGLGVIALVVTFTIATLVQRFVDVGSDGSVIALALVLMGANVALEFPANAFTGIIGAFSRFDLLSYSRFSMLLISSAATFYVVKQGYGIVAMALVVLTCGQISNVIYVLLSKYCFRELKVGMKWFRWAQVKELVHFSAWSMLSSVSTMFKFRLQPVTIAMISGPITVSHYAVGSRLSDYFRDILYQATSLTTPVLAKHHALSQSDQIKEKLLFLTKVNTILAVVGGGVIVILGRAFIERWLGADFVSSYSVLVILVCAMAVEIIMDPAKSTLAAVGGIKQVGILELIEAVINVALTIVLVMTYGMIGAAIGTAVPLLLVKLLAVPRTAGLRIGVRAREIYMVIAPATAALGAYLTIYGLALNAFFEPRSYFELIVAGVAPLPIAAIVGYLMMTDREHQIILRILPFKVPFFGPRSRL